MSTRRRWQRRRPDSRSYTDFIVRTSLPADLLRSALGEAVAGVSSEVSIVVRAFDDMIRDGLVQERLLSTVSGFFGALAVIVAAIGLYGVMSRHVAHRTSDIGVRIALGASRRDILLMVLLQAGGLLVAGLTVGGALSFGAAAAVRSFLFGVGSPATALVLAAGLLAATAAVACLLPARRAARLDPHVALREE